MLDIFTQEQWNQVKADYEEWWSLKREKPIIHLAFHGKDPGMKRPEGLITTDTYKYVDDTPEQIAEKLEYMMRSKQYEFNGYPYSWLYFGPMASVEYIGCKAHPMPNTVWHEPKNLLPPSEMHIRPDPESVYLPRVRAIKKAMDERFGGGYVISGGLGGGSALDVVAEFYGHEELSFMLYDEPEEVHRLMAESTAALMEVCSDHSLTPNAVGYTGWGGIFAPEPWGTCQCDYCAMIGPDHFSEFALPELTWAIARSPKYNYYHLDGTGEIIHQDKILDIPHLKCMQWVADPGADHETSLGVYERIYKKGINMWVTGGIEMARDVAERNGSTKGIYWYGEYPMSEYDRVMKMAEDLMNGH